MAFNIDTLRRSVRDSSDILVIDMEFRKAMRRVDGILMVVALVGCIHAVTLSPTNSSTSSSRHGGDAISATDRMYLESLPLQGTLTFDNTTAFGKDWGQLRTHLAPAAVLHPTSVADVATIVQAAARSESELTVAARGLGSSIGGQSQVLQTVSNFAQNFVIFQEQLRSMGSL